MLKSNLPVRTFLGVRFFLFGFDPTTEHKIRCKLLSGGGVDAGFSSQNCTHVIVDNTVYDDSVCATARTDGKTLVTSLWVDHSVDIGMPVDASSIMYRPLRNLNGILGAKQLSVCLTGYQRQDRDDIMTMVGLMGAQFSKPLIANKVTHLICYKFEGEKFELANRMKNIKLVNHQWLEDCLKDWRLLPEEKYSKSGHELEMMGAEAKDSEEEHVGAITKHSGGGGANKRPQDVNAGKYMAHEFPESKEEEQGVSYDSGDYSKGLSGVVVPDGNKPVDLGRDSFASMSGLNSNPASGISRSLKETPCALELGTGEKTPDLSSESIMKHALMGEGMPCSVARNSRGTDSMMKETVERSPSPTPSGESFNDKGWARVGKPPNISSGIEQENVFVDDKRASSGRKGQQNHGGGSLPAGSNFPPVAGDKPVSEYLLGHKKSIGEARRGSCTGRAKPQTSLGGLLESNLTGGLHAGHPPAVLGGVAAEKGKPKSRGRGEGIAGSPGQRPGKRISRRGADGQGSTSGGGGAAAGKMPGSRPGLGGPSGRGWAACPALATTDGHHPAPLSSMMTGGRGGSTNDPPWPGGNEPARPPPATHSEDEAGAADDEAEPPPGHDKSGSTAKHGLPATGKQVKRKKLPASANEKAEITCPAFGGEFKGMAARKGREEFSRLSSMSRARPGTAPGSEKGNASSVGRHQIKTDPRNKQVMEPEKKLPMVAKAAKKRDHDGSASMKEAPWKAEIESAWFILSGHKFQRKEFQQVIRLLKGRYCRDSHQWSYRATHFIAPGPIRRTEKFFAAAASGRWILKMDYLAACGKAGKFLPEEPYEWHEKDYNEDAAIDLQAPRKWRMLRERTGHGALYGMRIIIYGECIAPSLDTLKRAMKAGDGIVLATSPPYTRFIVAGSGVDYAVVSPGIPCTDVWVGELLKNEIPCVVADYLVEYVCKPGHSLHRHVLYETHAWAERSFANLASKVKVTVDGASSAVLEEVHDVADDTACQVCGEYDREEVMLICGNESGSVGCGIAMHIDCCNPSLENVPEEDWFCPACARARDCSAPEKRSNECAVENCK